jgi:hypothetical protein
MRPRLLAVACMVILCWAAISGRIRAQSSGDPSALIEWSANRSLTIKDFKGKIPARAAEASRSLVAIEASWECEGGKGSWRARAVFDSGRSWWREPVQNIWQGTDTPSLLAPKDDGGRSLLAHEQLHFDLTEIWARKIRERFTTLPAACKTPGGSHAFDHAIAEMERDWQDEQARYDKETGNGMDAGRQKAWAARAAKALNEP